MLYLKRYRGDGTAVNVETIYADAGEGWGVRVLPNMGYRGMCGPKGYVVSAVFVINRVSILVNFGHSGNK